MPTTVTNESEIAWVHCSCCDKDIRDTPEENVEHGTGHNNVGVGGCVECFGDKRVAGDDEAAVRRRLGWAGEMFYDARVKVLAEKLSPNNAANFATMPYAKKVRIIARLIDRGVII